jgi:thymidylate synthase (FAD)
VSDASAAAPEPQFRSDMTVELVKASAQDSDVVWAARVSTAGEKSLAAVGESAEKDSGLIRYLMRDRHGCYDDQTEVLTRDGWKAWPDVTGDEEFLTLGGPYDDEITYARARRRIRKPYSGPMVSLSMTHVDLLVTPDHNMFAERRRQPGQQSWGFVPASDFHDASHRVRMGGGEWSAPEWFKPHALALIGFFLGNGYLPRSGSGRVLSFRLRKERELAFLHRTAALAGFGIRAVGDGRYYVDVDEDTALLAKKCYDDDRNKVVPREVLELGVGSLGLLLDGLMSSDGSVSSTGTEMFSTTSAPLAGQLQEIALKLGRAAVVRDHPFDKDPAHFGTKPRYSITLYRDRNLYPKVGWTAEARRAQVRTVDYDGEIHCVTVPSGILYVRRNGKPMWCGNSPFEHNSMTYFISAPIFVFREFMRHRIGWSYNEESGRYRELRPVFYVPAPERKLVQEGKPGQYVFVDGTPEQHDLTVQRTKDACLEAYRAYQDMLAAGVAREVARTVLPVGTYSSMYATCNARSLMAFLSLRTKREDSRFPSFPQREIEMVAERMEEEWARLMPITHAAFDANGRVAP